MRRFRRIAVILGLAAALPLAATSLMAGPWDVVFVQSGFETQTVVAGTSFEVRGDGFHARVLPVKVCLSGSQCQMAEVDPAGNFVVTRTINQPGSYVVTVHQAQGISLRDWRLKTSKSLTVTN
jgi:hypothetical protein